MKILVTGGAGFIGSNFIRYMLRKHKNYEIVNLDKLTYAANPANLKDVEKNPRYKFIKGDICDRKLVFELVTNCDAILNFAAESHVDRSIKAPTEFIKTNVFGTQVLLDAAKKYRIVRYIQISTDEIYGSVTKGYSNEDSNLKPNSPYAASKAAADMLARSYYVTYNLPVIIIRSSNNFGPYQYLEKVAPLFITNLIEGKKLPLYGDGKNIRDWLYVGDNCRAVDLILRKGKIGEIYNVGGGNQIRNIDLALTLLKEFNLGRNKIQYVTDRPGHDRRYALNSNKVRKLGFNPRYTFNQALKATIAWYKKNQWWWKPLKKKAYIIKW